MSWLGRDGFGGCIVTASVRLIIVRERLLPLRNTAQYEHDILFSKNEFYSKSNKDARWDGRLTMKLVEIPWRTLYIELMTGIRPEWFPSGL
jgi:hypothetical protein